MVEKNNLIEKFQSVLKNPIMIEGVDQFLSDWRGVFKGKTKFVVFPSTTEEVSKIVILANKFNIPLVPQGGNTGLCGGATPDNSGNSILINFTKLNNIRNIDLLGNTVTVEAGCILENVLKIVEEQDRNFPINLAAKGSCTIGGNLATNAGGINVLKYGPTRDLVLGIEAILPNGEIINNLNALHKDNTGYALHKLMVGSEGTLGLITAATIRIFKKPKASISCFIQVKDIDKSIETFHMLQSLVGNNIEAFEIMSKPILEIVHKQFPKIIKPFPVIPELSLLVEFTTTSDLDLYIEDTGESFFQRRIIDVMSYLIEKDLIEDAVVSQSEQQNKELWEIRENANIAQMQEGFQLKLDISLPIENMSNFWAVTSKMLKREHKEVKICSFGHLGDGNLHYNLMDEDQNKGYVYNNQSVLKELVYEKIIEFKGSFSAEHGIGQLKIKELEKYKDQNSLKLMKTIKNTIDPKNILNPGKILI